MVKGPKISIEDNKDGTQTFKIDNRSNGLRVFCIIAEVILLVIFIPLESRIPIAGKGLQLRVFLWMILVAPISLITGYGIVISFRQKSILLNLASRTGVFTIDYMLFKRIIPFGFDDVEAVLLESGDAGPPPGVTANGREGVIAAHIVFKNGLRKPLAMESGKADKVRMLHSEIEQAIMTGRELPLTHFTERITVAKPPTNDGVCILEVSKRRNTDRNVGIIFGLVTTIFCILFTALAYFVEEALFAIIGISLGGGIFGTVTLIPMIKFLVSRNAKVVIVIDEPGGVLDITGGSGVHHAAYNIDEIEGTGMSVERKVTYTKNGNEIETFYYWPTVTMIGGAQVCIYKSDRYLEGVRLGKILGMLLAHAREARKNPNTPPLPPFTYDTIYENRERKTPIEELD